MADGTGSDIWSIVLLAAVGIVPLAGLLLVYKPRPFKRPDKQPGETSAMSEVLRDDPGEHGLPQRLEFPWEVPGKTIQADDRTEKVTFGKLLLRGIRNELVEGVYMLIPLIGVLALVVAVIVVAIFS